MSHHHHHKDADGASAPVVVAPAASEKLTFGQWFVGIVILLVIAAAGGTYVYFRYIRGGLLVEGMSCTLDRECESHNCFSHGKNWRCEPEGYGDHSFPAAAPCTRSSECRSNSCVNSICLGR